jgi:hypothetical protein
MNDDDKKDIYDEFKDLVNMSASELKKWLETDESKSVGQKKDGGESTGHKSGERIIDIKETKKSDLTDDDYKHMQKVIGYIKRHSAQRPKEVEGSDWEYSLKNWGNDPGKK